jgi:hypothetical protein
MEPVAHRAGISYAFMEQKRGSPRDDPIMQLICCHVAALTVASIFYTWRAYAMDLLSRHRQLRERVAYMLWVAAEGEWTGRFRPEPENALAGV